MTTDKKMTELRSAFVELTESLNYMGGGDAKKAIMQDVFGRLHRTSQQDFMRTVIVPILQVLAKSHSDGWTDARNAAAAEMAHKMLEAVRDDQYLPFV